MKRKLILFLAGASVLATTSSLVAKSSSETKYVTYRNINVNYNGVNQPMSREPFLLDGSVYVPLRAFGQICDINATWNPYSNTVFLTNTGYSSNTDISQLTYENTVLKRQLEAANARIKLLEDSSASSINTVVDIDALEDRLERKYYDYFDNIEFEFDVKKSASTIFVDISYDRSSEDRAFSRLSSSTIKSFMQAVCDTIRTTYTNYAIEGTISYGSTDKYRFSQTSSGSFSYSTPTTATDREVENILKRYSTLSSSNVGTLYVDDYSASVSESRNRITVYLDVDSSNINKTDWSTSSDRTLKSDLVEISDHINDEFGNSYTVYIYVRDDDNTGNTIASYYSDDNTLSLSTWK